MSYLEIEDYGIIGDLHSAALVGINGSIDWCCLPNFDSPSVFAGILDDEKGGWWKLTAHEVIKRRQSYLPESNILVTRSYTGSGVGQVENFMPLITASSPIPKGVHRIMRRLSCVRGTVHYTLDCQPAFNYALNPHRTSYQEGGVIFETDGSFSFGLSSPIPLMVSDRGVRAEITLNAGEQLNFCFFCFPKDTSGDPFSFIGNGDQLFEETDKFWQTWIAGCTYDGRWSETVYRSALVLKLLTFEPTGAIVAAPTMGIPEEIGGERNWDYRYTWIRDASLTVRSLVRIGLRYEAERFIDWVSARMDEMDVALSSPINLMYRLDGSRNLDESLLPHLKGYKNSSPVRLGNGAAQQLQLDIFGELIDALSVVNHFGKPFTYRQWSQVRKMMTWLTDNWDKPDDGIWETRGGRQDFVFSRLMCWVAFDRASRLSSQHSLPGDVARWTSVRDQIYDQIMLNGWNEKRQAFRQHYKTDALDASNLLMPLMKFISPIDPRMVSTVNETLSCLTTDSLVFRYDPKYSPDGLRGKEGTFCICTFWLVECLALGGRVQEARLIFQKMLGYANHVGLYGEEIGLHGETLGNFPQAFTHLGLISAAIRLDHALERKQVIAEDRF